MPPGVWARLCNMHTHTCTHARTHARTHTHRHTHTHKITPWAHRLRKMGTRHSKPCHSRLVVSDELRAHDARVITVDGEGETLFDIPGEDTAGKMVEVGITAHKWKGCTHEMCASTL